MYRRDGGKQLSAPPVKLAVEYLLPRAKVQAAVGDRYDDFAAHDLPLEVGVVVVLGGAVVAVALFDSFFIGVPQLPGLQTFPGEATDLATCYPSWMRL